jgi:hypothetical protein
MDRGVFFLAATVVGAGIGYFIGKSQDDDAPVVAKVFGIWNSRKGAFTAMGALLGASVAATYLYVELLFRAVIWSGEACMNHPIRALVITAVFIGAFAIGFSQDNGDKPPRGRRV